MASTGDDCYFYYYSECKKAAYCPFRHSAPARGTEDICPDWKQGKCSIPNCPRRHMIIQVQRGTIQCYWEGQPGGCQKAHCPFKHVSKKEIPRVTSAVPSNNGRDAAPIASTNMAPSLPNPQAVPSASALRRQAVQVASPVKPQAMRATAVSKFPAAPAALAAKYQTVRTQPTRTTAHPVSKTQTVVCSLPVPQSTSTSVAPQAKALTVTVKNRIAARPLLPSPETRVDQSKHTNESSVMAARQQEAKAVKVQSLREILDAKKRSKSNQAPRTPMQKKPERMRNTDEVRVKTLDEIRAEKRKRQEADGQSVDSQGSNIESPSCEPPAKVMRRLNRSCAAKEQVISAAQPTINKNPVKTSSAVTASKTKTSALAVPKAKTPVTVSKTSATTVCKAKTSATTVPKAKTPVTVSSTSATTVSKAKTSATTVPKAKTLPVTVSKTSATTVSKAKTSATTTTSVAPTTQSTPVKAEAPSNKTEPIRASSPTAAAIAAREDSTSLDELDLLNEDVFKKAMRDIGYDESFDDITIDATINVDDLLLEAESLM